MQPRLVAAMRRYSVVFPWRRGPAPTTAGPTSRTISIPFLQVERSSMTWLTPLHHLPWAVTQQHRMQELPVSCVLRVLLLVRCRKDTPTLEDPFSERGGVFFDETKRARGERRILFTWWWSPWPWPMRCFPSHRKQ